MPKTFLVDGRELICVNEADFDYIREQFKENITVTSLENWDSKEEMEKDNALTFITKARHYVSQSPPDFIQSAEKLWFAAVYALKELFLSSGGIDLRSHKALRYFFRFSLDVSDCPRDKLLDLMAYWTKAEGMHQSHYGSNLSPNEQKEAIPEIEIFVREIAQFDRKKLWEEFNKKFIIGNIPDVVIKKKSTIIVLGGINYKCEYSVFV